MSVDRMKRNLQRKFRKYQRRDDNPHGNLHNPGDLHKCVSFSDTEEGDIRISFKEEEPPCEDLKDRYREILNLALKGGETIYRSLKGEVQLR